MSDEGEGKIQLQTESAIGMHMQIDAMIVEDCLHDVVMHVTDMKEDVVSIGK